MEWSNAWVITVVILSCCGIVLTCLTGVLFYRYRETPIINASGKELSFILIFGILLSYFSVFSLTAYPSAVSCGVSRFMVGLSFTICYSSILVKTNRIYRVLESNKIKHTKLLFVTTKSQLLLIVGIICIEIGILLSWSVFDLPNVFFKYPTRDDNVRLCDDFNDVAFLVAMIFPFLLVLLCMFYAIKARKSKSSFRYLETHLTFACSSAILIVWIAFASVYFFVEGHTTKPFTLCFSSFVNASIILLILCITKVYIAINRPEKNTREHILATKDKRVANKYVPCKSECKCIVSNKD